MGAAAASVVAVAADITNLALGWCDNISPWLTDVEREGDELPQVTGVKTSELSSHVHRLVILCGGEIERVAALLPGISLES